MNSHCNCLNVPGQEEDYSTVHPVHCVYTPPPFECLLSNHQDNGFTNLTQICADFAKILVRFCVQRDIWLGLFKIRTNHIACNIWWSVARVWVDMGCRCWQWMQGTSDSWRERGMDCRIGNQEAGGESASDRMFTGAE